MNSTQYTDVYTPTDRNKKDNRSRKYKITRELNKAAFSEGQSRIPDYFKILNEIQILAAKNKLLEENFHSICISLENHNSSLCLPQIAENGGGLLSLLMNSAKNNASRAKTARRYDDTIKMFMSYIRMLGGSLLYETLHANLPHCIPSPSTVNQYIADKGPRLTEGELRTEELYEYLMSRDLPLVVCISEDGTRMIGKVCFDPRTNKLVGFSLPLNENGMPITNTFIARSASEIESHFLNGSVSTVAYVIMAQPPVQNIPPFALTLFSIDNKFTSLDVLRRWSYIRAELGKKGIRVLTYASDGDSRLLLAMKIVSGIGGTSHHSDNGEDQFTHEWFNCRVNDPEFPVSFQDFIHVLTKLRNRVLRHSAILALGNGTVSKTFLKYLIDTVSKDKHGLTNTDIEPQDRQNAKSASNICEVRTQDCLTKYVPGSQSTVLYLKMMRAVTFSMLDANMDIRDRIFNLWYGVFILRIWRSWLLKFTKQKKNKKNAPAASEEVPTYSLQENFISNNAYTCIELNAHSLILLTIKLRSNPELFVPYLFGSQSCESTFGQLRSMTSTYSTVVNFTMLEMINRLKKVQLQSDIVTSAPDNIKFPRFQKEKVRSALQEFPSNAEIICLLERARMKGMEDISKVGIDVPADQDFSCQIKYERATDPSTLDAENDLYDEDDCESEVDQDEMSKEVNALVAADVDMELTRDVHTLSSVTGEIILRNYGECTISLSETSPYTVVHDSLGNEKVVRKSTICWLLTKNKHSLSSDRLTRVKQCELMSKSKL